jgi:hypothetical protein
MSTVATKAPSRAARRTRALDRWIEQLRRQSDEHAAPAASHEPLAIRVALQTLTVEPWVQAEIRRAFDRPNESTERPTLVAHAVALRMKIEGDRARMRQAHVTGGHELYAVQAELMLDSAIGTALNREIQRVIDEEVQRGGMASAKHWTSLKNELNRVVSTVNQLLADSERQRAETLSDKLTDARVEPVAPERYERLMQRLDVEERERKQLARARKRARDALANLPSRTEVLVAALAVTVAIWLGFVKLPEHLASGLPVLGTEDFPRADGFVDVVARPPSLYVTVDGDVWSGLAGDERRRLVSTISGVLLTSGYTGVLLKTEAGRPVAQWLALNGVTLIETDETLRAVDAFASTPDPIEVARDP